MTLTQYLKEQGLKNTKAVKAELAKSVGFTEYEGTAADNAKLVELLTTKSQSPKLEGVVDLFIHDGQPANVKEYAEKIKIAEDQKSVPKGFKRTTIGYLVKA